MTPRVVLLRRPILATLAFAFAFALAAAAAPAGGVSASDRLDSRRYCLRRRRPARRGGVLFQPVLYRNTGRQLTTWRVNGKIVGRWRWRVVPEIE